MNRTRNTGERRGTTLVEFAVVLPVFGLMMVGILEFGHLYMVHNTMAAAAKKAGRYGAVSEVTNADVTARVTEILGSAIDMSKAYDVNHMLS